MKNIHWITVPVLVTLLSQSLFACVCGKWGDNCEKDCHCFSGVACHQYTGNCSTTGCAQGYAGSSCNNKCGNDTFGLNCELECHCLNNSLCDIVNGSCPLCAPGWMGDNCQRSCDDGWYGMNCSQKCRCFNDTICGSVTGICMDGCAVGWTGHRCNDIDCGYCGIHTCVRSGRFKGCQCAPGYQQTSQVSCKDIDECQTLNKACGPDFVCINKPGSFSCHCRNSSHESISGKICTEKMSDAYANARPDHLFLPKSINAIFFMVVLALPNVLFFIYTGMMDAYTLCKSFYRWMYTEPDDYTD